MDNQFFYMNANNESVSLDDLEIYLLDIGSNLRSLSTLFDDLINNARLIAKPSSLYQRRFFIITATSVILFSRAQRGA